MVQERSKSACWYDALSGQQVVRIETRSMFKTGAWIDPAFQTAFIAYPLADFTH
jgi:hypothetical protein